VQKAHPRLAVLHSETGDKLTSKSWQVKMNEGTPTRQHSGNDRGFGLIEIVVSMFLLTLLVLSFAPVLVNTNKFTARNTTIATATQIVNQQIEAARAVRSSTSTPPTCHDITQFLSVTSAPIVDPRGVTLQAQWDPVTCPSTYPGVVRVRVAVTQPGFASATASAVTFIYVTSAGS
jgi:type II secretory pathway pseudopilin PulG